MKILLRILTLAGVLACSAYSHAQTPSSANPLMCKPGFVLRDNVCRPRPEIPRGSWHNGQLQCEDGYIRLTEPDGSLSCHKLPEVEHGRWEGISLKCDNGFTRDHISCVPTENVDAGQTQTPLPRLICPETYVFDEGGCLNSGTGVKTIVVKDFELQGLRLGMREAELLEALEQLDYEKISGRIYAASGEPGTKKRITYRLTANPGSPEKTQRLFQFEYSQTFPPDVSFELDTTLQHILERFGTPDFMDVTDSRWELVYTDDDADNSTLKVSASGKNITMEMTAPLLLNEVHEQLDDLRDEQIQTLRPDKPKAVIEF